MAEERELTNFYVSFLFFFVIFFSFVIKFRPCDQRKTKLNLAIDAERGCRRGGEGGGGGETAPRVFRKWRKKVK